jgi:hypothetical protein
LDRVRAEKQRRSARTIPGPEGAIIEPGFIAAPVLSEPGAPALPPQRMGVQTLPDDSGTAPEVDQSADVFAGVQRQAPTADTAALEPTPTPALPPQRMGVQTLPDDANTAPEVDESADVFSGVQRQRALAPAPASSEPGVTNTQSPSAAAAPAPTPDAQAYEDALVAEARSAGIKVASRKALGIKEDIKGKGWYPGLNVNKAVAEIRERVRQRLETETAPEQGTAPTSTPDPLVAGLPDNAGQLIRESRNKGQVPSSSTLNARYGETGTVQPLSVEQRRAIRREAMRQVAEDYGIAYDENLEFNKDFEGNDNVPVRVSETGTEPVFVNDPDVTARQIDQGFIPTVPENQRGNVVQGIVFDPETGRVTSATSRGVEVSLPGQLEGAVRSQRPVAETDTPLTSKKEQSKMASQVKGFNSQDLADYQAVAAAVANMSPRTPQIEQRFSTDDLATKALSIWVNERAKDKQRPASQRKNYTAGQVWGFANEKAFDKVRKLPQQISLDAPVGQDSGPARIENVRATEEAAKDDADREAANEEADALDEGVTVDQPDNVSGSVRPTSSGMNYDQAFNIVNSPKLLEGIPKKQARALRAEAQEMLDLASQEVIDELEANDIDYWTWTAEEFRNVDAPDTQRVVSSSPRAAEPYISEQRSWVKSVARALGVRRFTPAQFDALARYYANRYRPYFFAESNSRLPENAVVLDLPGIRQMFAGPEGAASTYRGVLEQLLAEFPGVKIGYNTKENANAWVNSALSKDTIFVNPLFLENDLDGLSPSEAYPYLRAMLFEEFIHLVEQQTVPEDFIIALAKSLPEDVRRKVLEEYVGPVSRYENEAQRQMMIDSIDDSRLGSEYVRMMIQRLQNGQTTEDLAPENLPKTVFDQLMQIIKTILSKLEAQLTVGSDPYLAHIISRIEKGMRVLESDRRAFTRPKPGTLLSSVDPRTEAQKVKANTNYWVKPDGRVIDIYAEAMGRISREPDEETAVTHGRYIQQWLSDRLDKFYPDQAEVAMAERIRDSVTELLRNDPTLVEELDPEIIEAAYQDEVITSEALGLEPPDQDQFVADMRKGADAASIAYVQAAEENGWGRISSVAHVVKRRAERNNLDSDGSVITVETLDSALGTGASRTLTELSNLKKVQTVTDGAIQKTQISSANPELGFGLGLRYWRSLPDQSEFTKGTLYSRPGRSLGRRAVVVPRKKGSLLKNIAAMITGRYTETKNETGGFFSSGNLTPLERDILHHPTKKISETAASVEFTVGEFRRAVKQAYPNGDVPAELINKAFGSADNPLTDAQVTALKSIKDAEVRDAKRAEFKARNRERAKAERQDALAELPRDVAKWVTKMRDKVDELSTKMIENGYVAESLIPVIDANMELYFHREYMIFESPEWKNNMLNPQNEEHLKVRVAAEKLFRDRAIAERAVELMRVAREQGSPITKAEAKLRARADAPFIEGRVNDLLLEYLSVADENAKGFFLSGKAPGQRNMGIIKVRGQIPKEIRDLWGEVKNAETNFSQTVTKMSAFMAQHDAATQLLQHGIEQGYVWKKDYDNRSVFNGKTRKWDVILGEQRQEGFNSKEEAEAWRQAELPKVQESLQARVSPPGYVPLVDSGSANPQSIAPLDGAYGPPELADALKKLTSPQESSAFYRGVSFTTAMFMAMKTIGYFPQAYVRNFLSNPFGQLISGGINIQNWGMMGDAFRTGVNVARLNAGLRGNMANVGTLQELREKLLRLGVLQDNPRGYFLKMLYEEGIGSASAQELLSRKEFKNMAEKVSLKALQGSNRAFMKMAEIYQGIDDLWKAYGWLVEIENQRRAHPDWTQEQLEQKAAEQIRDMVWTYSMSPEVTKRIRRIPVIAPFITWTSEVIRATSNAVAIASEEMRVGKETGNRAMYLNGVNRRVGQIVAFSLLPAIAESMKYILGYDDEDEEALRTMLPEWQQNAQLVLLPKKNVNEVVDVEKDGKLLYVDLSYLDPLQVFKEPGIAMLRAFNQGDSLADILAETASQAIAPVASEQLFFGAVADLVRNRRASGMPVWNETDTPANKTKAMLWHLIEAGGPGMVVGTAPRIYKAAIGEVSRSGRSFSLGAEIAAPLTGQRISEVDAETSLRQAMGRYKGLMSQSTGLLTDIMLSRGTVRVEDIPGAYDNANRAKKEAFDDMVKFYNAALTLGVPKATAISVLRGVGPEAGLSQDMVGQIISNKYLPYRPSPQMLNRAVVQPGGRERVAALAGHLQKVYQEPRD